MIPTEGSFGLEVSVTSTLIETTFSQALVSNSWKPDEYGWSNVTAETARQLPTRNDLESSARESLGLGRK